jgi:hypothetical protein
MSPVKRRLPLIALVVVAAALTGCGGKSRDIPPDQASNLERLLAQAERRTDAGACGILQSETFPALESAVTSLPRKVKSNLRSALRDGVRDLEGLAESECSQNRLGRQTETETTPTETQTSGTETAPTETAPVQTITQTQPPKEPKQPKTEPATQDQGTGGSGPPGQEKKGKGD